MVYKRKTKKDWIPPTDPGRVVKNRAPKLNILIKNLTQMVAMVEEVWELKDELRKEAEAERRRWADQGRGSQEDLEEAEKWVKSQEEYKVLSAEDLEGAKEWLLQGGMKPRHLW